MTTIVATRQTMAADKRVTDEDAGTRWREKKIRRIGDALVGAAGSAPAISKFFKWLEGGQQDDPPKLGKDDELRGLVLTPAGLFIVGTDCVLCELDDPFFAVGSGAQAALGALHMGATAPVAVEIASTVDNQTGDGIDVLTL
jgi:ATP-dependent protease HslVU (ClpYQ) peptidase subunit